MNRLAVIFDMDGVLLDSEPYYYKYLTQRFQDHNVKVTDEEYRTFVGLPTREVWKYVEQANGAELDIDSIIEKEEDQVNAVFRQAHLAPITGIPELLKALKDQDVLTNVASSSARSTIELIVDKLELNAYFNFFISGTEVPRGKPHPDIFLESARIHDLQPENCIVIEDSTNGVKAAKAAGMYCIGFENPGSGQQDLSEADKVINNYNEVAINLILSRLGS